MTDLVGAIDIGATKTLVTVRPLPLAAWTADHRTLRLVTPTEPTILVERVASGLASLRALAGGSIVGVGVGTPGPLDAERGTILHSPNQGWFDVPLGPMLSARLGVPVAVDDDANTGALGEANFGAGAGADPVAYVTVSTGIGAGIIVAGRIVRGAHGAAGEVGHLQLDPAGPRCTCGRRGCVEVYASGGGLERRARATWPRATMVSGLAPPRSAADVFRTAREGDDDARRLIAEATDALARAFAVLVATLDPERIVVGGALGLAQRGYVARAARIARGFTIPGSGAAVAIVPAAFRGESVLVGAAVLAAAAASDGGGPARAR